MIKVFVEKFGGIDQLQVRELPTPEPGPGEVRVRITSIGMNHAELMARRGEYKLSSGEPPFTPGLEGGGIVEAIGDGVDPGLEGRRVILTADAPRRAADAPGMDGTYTSHFITTPDKLLDAPQNLPDDQLGIWWLAYLTSWGCLVWKQQIQPGQYVGIPAASSALGIAAGQIVKAAGAIPIGLTTGQDKADALAAMGESAFEHLIVTNTPDRRMRRWHKDLLRLTNGHGIDAFFDPVGNGEYLDLEIRALAQHGTIWIYGLLGEAGPVDMSPLIRKSAGIRGWILSEVYHSSPDAARQGYEEILSGVANGKYRMPVAARFPLREVQRAHAEMEKGHHIGKMVLVP